MTIYSLSNLPKGCYYYPARRELVINCPIVDEDQVVLYPTHMLYSNAKNMFGRWKVCSDDVRVENNEVATTVDTLVQRYLEVVIIMHSIVNAKKNSPEAISKRQWASIKVIFTFAALAISIIAVSITLLVLGLYCQVWFT